MDATAWQSWSTGQAGGDAAGYWSEVIFRGVCDADFEADMATAFAARLASRQRLGSRFVAFRAAAHRVRRTARQAARGDDSHYMIGLQRHGGALAVQGGEAVSAAAGEIVVLHSGRPFELVFPKAVERRLVMLPRTLLDRHLPVRSALASGQPLRLRPEASASGLMARDALLHLTMPGTDWAEADLAAGLEHLARALGSAVGQGGPLAGGERPGLSQLRGMVARHMAEPGFGLAALAGRLGVAPRTLQRRLEAAGTSFSRLLMEMRLEAARRCLEAGGAEGSILTVALDCGFSDAAHFSRSYRARYGETPSQTLGRSRAGVAGRP